MALTTELLNANQTTSGLTDDQKAAIVEMSQNDESAVIGQKVGEIYGGLDTDILSASGIAKNGTEKTYDYAKRVIGELKAQGGDIAAKQKEIDALTKEKTRLEGVIASGGADAETKKALTQARADLANVTKEYTELKTKFNNAESTYAKQLMDVRMETEFAKASSGIKFKADLPKTVTDVLMGQAVAKVKAMNPEYIDDGKGGKVLAFMQNGTPMRNPERNLNPYTASELVEKELRDMGVLETPRRQTGAGSEGGQGGSGGTTVDLSGARTQTEANEILTKQLLQQGKTVGSKEFQDALTKAWTDNKDFIKSLPLR